MSFQAYLRKLQNEKKSFASLENLNCSIKDKCSTGHPQWPKGKFQKTKYFKKNTISLRNLHEMSTESNDTDESSK